MSAEPLLPDATSAARSHLTEALAELRQAAKSEGAEARTARVLSSLLEAVMRARDSRVPLPLSDSQRAALAQLLASRRQAAGLSQQRVAKLTQLSERTIRHIESGQHTPSWDTLERLANCAELRMGDEALGEREGGAGGPMPNSWLNFRYDPLSLGLEVARVLNGPGGPVEQTLLYFDAESASDWLALSMDPTYAVHFRLTNPLDEAARLIAAQVGHAGVDVCGLGVGDGQSETRLAEHLANELPAPLDLRLKLLDISHVLLTRAYRHAADRMESRGVPVQTLHANFHHLRDCPEMYYQPPSAPRRYRVYTLLGSTLANLENEVQWFRELHVCAQPGDFCMLDIQTCYAPPDRPDEIALHDPPLAAGRPPATHERWISGLLRRHCRNAVAIELRNELAPAANVPGSYQIDVMANVKLSDGREKRFVMWRVRRYDPDRLAACLAQLGWSKVAVREYGPPNGAKTAALVMLRRE